MELSRQQRWILSNQYEILAQLYPERSDHYEQVKEVVENGYSLAYDWYSDFLYEETSESTCKEVIYILDMFSAIQHSLDDLGALEGVDEWDLTFEGFDGNMETQHLSFASFLIEEEGRFQEHQDAGDDLNSHSPTLHRYRPMLQTWEEMDKSHDLTEEQIREIAEAPYRD